MKNKPDGEMPFLDHLEELRFRIFYSLIALVIGIGIALWAVLHFQVMDRLQAPVLPYLHGDKLVTMSLTEPWEIWIKLSLVGGIVLASPVIIYQVWGFLSPALLPKEKRAFIPALAGGLVLFLTGSWVSWQYLVPFSVEVLKDFPGNFTSIVTFDSYMDLVTILVLAIGIMAELPLLMTVLSWIGIVPSSFYRKFRRHAVVANLVLGAIISPGTSPVAMAVVTVPLLLLYEAGALGAWIVEKRKIRARKADAAMAGMLLLFFLGGMPGRLSAQIPPPVRQGTSQDTANRRPVLPRSAEDSARNKRLGIPNKPLVKFIDNTDSVVAALLKAHPGYNVTRFSADSGYVYAGDQRMQLMGRAGVSVRGDTIEGELLNFEFSDTNCTVASPGETNVFAEGQQPARGRNLRVRTCRGERLVMLNASTRTAEGGTDWFLMGNLAVDSSGKRLYMADGSFTTCENEISDYSFRSSEVKVISQSVLVAKSPVLYVGDVPLVWMPFMFQNTKRGRASGVLLPKFGFNDIVRPTRSYNRQVTDFGYYWAPNDYMDLALQVDWYANRLTNYRSVLNYKLRDRLVSGRLGFVRSISSDGSRGSTFDFSHDQSFNAATHLSAQIKYSTNGSVLQRNTVDPFQATQLVLSQVNFTKKMAWGDISLGGTRQQELNNGAGSMSLPRLGIAPRTLGFFGDRVSWSPNVQITNDTRFKTPLAPLLQLTPAGIDTLHQTASDRASSIRVASPIQIGSFQLPLSFSLDDKSLNARHSVIQRIPDPDHPGDSLTITTVRNGDYSTSFNWDFSLALPRILSTTFNIQPTVGVTNISPYPYFLRSAASNGKWVQQQKRLQYGISANPVFYSFLNVPIGPAVRFRHTFSPSIQYQYSPTANLPAEYARVASATFGGAIPVKTPASSEIAIALDQTFEAKLRPGKGDTTTDVANYKKIQLLHLSTSGVAYNFENAKLPGLSGWKTPTITNSIRSDLISGLTLSMTHDLFEGSVGTDTAVFKPYLTNVSAGFTLTANTFSSIGRIFGLSSKAPSAPTAPVPAYMVPGAGQFGGFRPRGSFGVSNAFSTVLQYSLQRRRPNAVPVVEIDPVTGLPITNTFTEDIPNQVNISLSTNFSPTELWHVSWQTMYDVTTGRFANQSIDLTRTLHDWTASFKFLKAATGNFSLFFSIALNGREQDVKFDYNQTTIRPTVP